ncbi:MAG: Ig-like domain-containing protein [Elusimicrobiota bacterium]
MTIEEKQTFSYTGAVQEFTVPGGVVSVTVTMWGAAGGGTGARGGAGGYSKGTIAVTPGEVLTIIVGGGGTVQSYNAPGGWPNGGRGGSTRGGYYGAGGGGRSSVVRGSDDLIVAGGGGGGGAHSIASAYGGAGGGSSGQNAPNSNWFSASGKGGSQTGGGSGGGSGSQSGGRHYGGSGDGWNGTGGGDGYYGGGGGDDHQGGGGGSGFIGGAGVTDAVTTRGSSGNPPGTAEPDYAAGVAVGNAYSKGGDGRVVVVALVPTGPYCGDGNVDAGLAEQCDDGNADPNDGCTYPECEIAVCGDGHLWAGVESCDEGNAITETQICGNSVVENGTFCNSDCSGTVTLTEVCDDGNIITETYCNENIAEDGSSCTFDCSAFILPLDLTGVKEFAFTAAIQEFTVPESVESVTAVMWGAGGGGGVAVGGAGGYSKGTMTVTPGETLTITVGGGGAGRSYNAPGGWPNGGRGGSTRGGYYGAGGGGRSSVVRGSSDLIVAGGGGGTGSHGCCSSFWGGAGGGSNGQNAPSSSWFSSSGRGGTQTGGGSGGGRGSQSGGFHYGGYGDSWNGTGGGDGYYGGGGGDDHQGGGGGSGYIGGTGVTDAVTSRGNAGSPPGTSDPDYSGGIASGGSGGGKGGDGKVVIRYDPPQPDCGGCEADGHCSREQYCIEVGTPDPDCVDNVAPEAAITAPADESFVARVVAISGTASDEKGIQKAQFFIDGNGQGLNEPPVYEMTWDTLAESPEGARLMPDGAHEIYLTAFDPSENIGASPVVTLKVDNAPPVTSLSPEPNGSDGWYKSPLPALTLSGDDGEGIGAREISWSLDGGPATVVPGASAEPAAGEGTHELSFFATDLLDNAEAPKTLTLRIDLLAPAAPGNPRTTFMEERRVDLAWDASADADGPTPSGTASYRVSRRVSGSGADFSTLGDTADLTFSDTEELDLGVTYDYRVFALDAAGNLSDPAELTVTAPDRTPPELTEAAGLVHADETSVTVTWVTDEPATSQVAFGAESGAYGDPVPAQVDHEDPAQLSTEHSVTVGGLAVHTRAYLRAISIDGFGNEGRADEFSVLLDTDPPTVAITSPADGWATNADVTIGFTVFDDLSPEGGIALRDDQGHDAPPFTFAQEGPRTVTLTATDEAGNSATASVSFTIDKTGPARIQDLTLAEQRPADGEADIAWTAPADALSAVAGYRLKSSPVPLSDANWDAGTPLGALAPSEAGTPETFTVSGLPAQDLHLAIRSEDSLGNLSPTSNNVVYDPVPPSVAITEPANGAVVSRPVTVSATASDPRGVARVEFLVDGQPAASATAPPYTFYFDIRDYDDGGYTLTARAFDTRGNSAEVSIQAVVSYAPPAKPTILSPDDGWITHEPLVSVTGSAEPGTTVQLLIDGSWGSAPRFTQDGQASFADVNLGSEGLYTLTMVASDKKGVSQPSDPVDVTLDLGPPLPPDAPEAATLPGGKIRISWSLPAGETPSAYRLYRSLDSADLPAGGSPPAAFRITDDVAETSYADLPPQDGLFFYGISSLDTAGNESVLSEAVFGVSDQSAPSAQMQLPGAVPPLGPGDYAIELTVTETLAALPLVTLKPPGQSPVSIPVQAESPTRFTGTLTVTSAMAPGAALFGFQGEDLVGNTGTAITSGGSVTLDTRGPVGTVTLLSAEVLSAGTLSLRLDLDEPAAATPALSFTPEGRAPVALSLAPLSGDGRSFEAGAAVDETTGDGRAYFAYSAADALGNAGTTLSGGAAFFTIDTAAPGPPQFLRANARPESRVELSWSAPLGAGDVVLYAILRDGMEIATAAPAPDGSGAYADQPAEGPHEYKVRARDAAGNDGPPSDPASASADGTPPPAPANLQASINGFGQIEVSWEAGAGEAAAEFRIYRSRAPITGIAGLTPWPAASPFIDAPLEDGTYHYAATALDAAGNEGPASDEDSVAFDKAAPVISVTGVSDGDFANEELTISFSAADDNLDPSSVHAALNGEPFESGATVGAEGEYTLTVTASDTGGHGSEGTIRFTIDRTDPELSLSGVEDGYTYFAPVSLSTSVSDANLVSDGCALIDNTRGTQAPYSAGAAIAADAWYTVLCEAADKAGNSASASLSFGVDTAPHAPRALSFLGEGGVGGRLTWQAAPEDPDVAGFRVFRDGVRISGSLLSTPSFKDTGYRDDAAHVYEVAAMDARGQEGARATVTVRPVEIALSGFGVLSGGQESLTRGFFDEVRLLVTNRASQALSVGPLELDLGSGAHPFEGATLAAGGAQTLSGVVAVAPGSSGQVSLRAVLRVASEPGTTARVAREFPLAVRDPQEPVVEVFPEALIRGTNAQVRMKFNNRGSAPLDIRTARASGGSTYPSDDVFLRIETPQGTLLSEARLEQTGNGANSTIVSGQQVFFVTIPGGSSFIFDPVTLFVPDAASGEVAASATVAQITHSLPYSPIPGERSFSGSQTAGTIQEPAYTATVDLISLDGTNPTAVFDRGQTVRIKGRAVDPAGSPLPDRQVALGLSSRGFDRKLSTGTGPDGTYEALFTPASNEPGQYAVSARHPDVLTGGIQAQFAVQHFGFQYEGFTARMSQNSEFRFSVNLTNFGETPVEGLAATVSQESEAEGVSLAIQPGSLPDAIGAGSKATLAFTAAVEPAGPVGRSAFVVTATEANGFSRSMTVFLDVSPSQALPVATPQAFQIGMLAGETRSQKIEIRNKGFDDWVNITLTEPTLDFARIEGSSSMGTLPPGGLAEITVVFEPPADLPTGAVAANPLFEIRSANASAIPINVGVTFTSSRNGAVAVNAVNADEPRDALGAGVGVPGAKATLTSLDVAGLTRQKNADANGVAQFPDVPSGAYTLKVEAAGFQPVTRALNVQPGLTESVEALMVGDYVSYEWTVTPTTIQDEYEVKLDITFQTNVPAPALVIEPALVDLYLEPGTTAYVQYVITNRGQVAADDVEMSPPPNIQLPFTKIPRLGPGESVVIAAKVTRGEGCSSSVGHAYHYECAAGSDVPARAQSFSVTTNCPGSPSSSSGSSKPHDGGGFGGDTQFGLIGEGYVSIVIPNPPPQPCVVTPVISGPSVVAPGCEVTYTANLSGSNCGCEPTCGTVDWRATGGQVTGVSADGCSATVRADGSGPLAVSVDGADLQAAYSGESQPAELITCASDTGPDGSPQCDPSFQNLLDRYAERVKQNVESGWKCGYLGNLMIGLNDFRNWLAGKATGAAIWDDIQGACVDWRTDIGSALEPHQENGWMVQGVTRKCTDGIFPFQHNAVRVVNVPMGCDLIFDPWYTCAPDMKTSAAWYGNANATCDKVHDFIFGWLLK